LNKIVLSIPESNKKDNSFPLTSAVITIILLTKEKGTAILSLLLSIIRKLPWEIPKKGSKNKKNKKFILFKSIFIL
jgi:hypothetical protein